MGLPLSPLPPPLPSPLLSILSSLSLISDDFTLTAYENPVPSYHTHWYHRVEPPESLLLPLLPFSFFSQAQRDPVQP